MMPSQPAFDGVEFKLGQGLSCFGEYAMPVTSSRAICIALHDDGEDLVSLRWLSVRLLEHGISQLLVDLPGHGLSDGSMSDDFSAALLAAEDFARSLGCSIVAYVAKGSTSHSMLLAEQPAPPVAAVLVSPLGGAPEAAVQHRCWQKVPKLAFIPSDDRDSAAFADIVVRQTHAWCLRANLAFEPKDAPISATAQTQIGSIAAKFLLEQIAFAEAADSSMPGPGQPATVAARGPVQP